MTTSQIEPVVDTSQGEDNLDDDLVHVCCCQSIKYALCGIDLTGHTNAPPTAAITCELCRERDERSSKTGSCTDVCPKVLRRMVDG